MEARSSSRQWYWLLVAGVLPALNWWIGLWVVVLARDMTPLLIVLPLLLTLESLAVTRRLRSDYGLLGTAGLLAVITFAWSLALTLIVFALQKNVFTF